MIPWAFSLSFAFAFAYLVPVSSTRTFDELRTQPETHDEWDQRKTDDRCWPDHIHFLIPCGKVDPRRMSFHALLFYWSHPTQEDMHMICVQNRKLQLKMLKNLFRDPAVPLWERPLEEHAKNGPMYTINKTGIPYWWEWQTPKVLEPYGEYITRFQNWKFVNTPQGNGR